MSGNPRATAKQIDRSAVKKLWSCLKTFDVELTLAMHRSIAAAEKVRAQLDCVMPKINLALVDLLEDEIFKAAISTHGRIPT